MSVILFPVQPTDRTPGARRLAALGAQQFQAFNANKCDGIEEYTFRGGVIHYKAGGKGINTLCGSMVGGAVPRKDKRVTCLPCIANARKTS